MDGQGDGGPLPAGSFSSWLEEMHAALRGERDAEVPCGTCTACCRSSQFVHIGPDETDTLAHIPKELLFPAPRRPRGHVLMGYDEHGHCPMLVDGRCSIYEHRPRTCRSYDCRVFPAAGVDPGEEGKELIAVQARRWEFGYSSDVDRVLHHAVRATAEHVRSRSEGRRMSATQTAVRAVAAHSTLLGDGSET